MWRSTQWRRLVHSSPAVACVLIPSASPAPDCHEIVQPPVCKESTRLAERTCPSQKRLARTSCRTVQKRLAFARGPSHCQEAKQASPLPSQRSFQHAVATELPLSRSQTSSLGKPTRLVRSTAFVYACVSGGSFADTYESVKGGDIEEGAFGKVFLVRARETGYLRAAKMIPKVQQEAELLRNEISALMDLDHPHIVKLLRYFDEGDTVVLVFELCQGPDLFCRLCDCIEQGSPMTEYEIAVAMRQILKAVKCCHGKYMGHYDIKPENFMYTDTDLHCLKMIDLGLSCRFSRTSSKVMGTIDYISPEVLRGVYGPEADMWSCGVVLFVMLTGMPLMDGDLSDEDKGTLINNRFWMRQRCKFAKDRGISDEAYDLLCRMLSHDRFMRISVREALMHPFITKTYKATRHDLRKEADKIFGQMMDNFRSFIYEPALKQAVRMVMAHIAGTHDNTHLVRYAFRLMDMSRSGELSIQVLENFVTDRGEVLPDDFERVFRRVDVNEDGYITLLEFLSVNLPNEVLQDEKLIKRVFRHLDRDRDGFISCGDLSEIFSAEDTHSRIYLDAIREVSKDGSSRLGFPEFHKMMCTDDKTQKVKS